MEDMIVVLVGGLNHLEKYESQWEIYHRNLVGGILTQ